jgi:ABC-type nitrate/sulfonate/bicarbonate transport system permease component
MTVPARTDPRAAPLPEEPAAPSGRRRPGLAGRVLPPLVFSLLVLGARQAYTELADISPLLLPSPWEAAQVVWFGFAIVPKVIVVALVCFFPIVVNTIDRLKAVDPEMVRLMRTLGMSRPRIMRSVRVPSALPCLFSGLKAAMALSVIGAVFGEWVGASEGLGYLMLALNNQLATDLFAAVLVLSVMGIVLFFLVGLVERLVIPWHHESRRALQQQQ